MRFEWDPDKAERNQACHQVTFAEAVEAFFDPNAVDECRVDGFCLLSIANPNSMLYGLSRHGRQKGNTITSMPKKNKLSTKSTQTIVVDVSAADYQADLAKGLQADETMQPGRHIFRRGGFLQRHGDAELTAQLPMPTKTRISIHIDADILDYFKARAAQPNAAPYQTQINNVLRTIMEQDQQQLPSSPASYADALLADQRFIEAVARRVAERSAAYETNE